jgi:hypothetical protein
MIERGNRLSLVPYLHGVSLGLPFTGFPKWLSVLYVRKRPENGRRLH